MSANAMAIVDCLMPAGLGQQPQRLQGGPAFSARPRRPEPDAGGYPQRPAATSDPAESTPDNTAISGDQAGLRCVKPPTGDNGNTGGIGGNRGDKPQPSQKDDAQSAPEPVLVQEWLAGYAATAHGNNGTSRDMQPKAGAVLAESLAAAHKAVVQPGPGQEAAITETQQRSCSLPAVAPGTGIVPARGNDAPQSAVTNLLAGEGTGTEGDGAARPSSPQLSTMPAGGITAQAALKAATGKAAGGVPQVVPVDPQPGADASAGSIEQPSGQQCVAAEGLVRSQRGFGVVNSGKNPAGVAGKPGIYGGGSAQSPKDVQGMPERPGTAEPASQGDTNAAHNQAGMEHFAEASAVSQNAATARAETSAAASAQQESGTQQLSGGVGRQVVESIRSSIADDASARTITIKLNPPELGQVRVEFSQDREQLVGMLQVDRLQTKSQIEQALPQIVSTLQQSGVNLKRLDVMLTDQHQGQPFEQQLHGDNGSRQQFGDFDRPGSEASGPTSIPPQRHSAYASAYERQTFFDGRSVNMLV